MAKELKDYLHLYLGCECFIKVMNEDRKVILCGLYLDNNIVSMVNGNKLPDEWVGYVRYWYQSSFFHQRISDIKPILRPLSDMTEDELDEILRIGEHQHNGNGLKGFITGWKAFQAETFKYLLSRSFDLYGLIESGLAIDKTTLNSTTLKQ